LPDRSRLLGSARGNSDGDVGESGHASGSFIGIQNGVGNIPGIVMPIATGLIIDWTGVYDNAFWLTAAVCLASTFWWLFGVPRIRQIDLD
jgi:nitrate/nitrite transporter NarK